MRGTGFWCCAVFIILSGCGNKESVEGYLQSGSDYSKEGDYKAAIIEYKNAARLEPSNPDVRLMLGRLYHQFGEYPFAVKELEKAAELGAGESSFAIPLFKSYLQLRKYDEVIARIRPDRDAGDLEKARLYSILGSAQANLNMPQARTSLTRALDLDSQHPDVLLAWAAYEGLKGNSYEQKKWLDRVLEKDPANADAWSQIAGIEMESRKLEDAIAAYTKSIDNRKFLHPDIMKRAMAYIESGQLDLAMADYETMSKANSPWVGVPQISGILAIKNNDWRKAREIFLKILASNPDYAPAQLLLATVEARENNLQNSLSLLEQYIDRIDSNKHANLLYIDLLIRLNMIDKAQDQLRKIYATDNKDSKVLALFGRAYLKQNKIEEAIEYFQKSIKINPDDFGTRLLLSEALLSEPRTKQLGRSELEELIAKQPNMLDPYQKLISIWQGKLLHEFNIISGIHQFRTICWLF